MVGTAHVRVLVQEGQELQTAGDPGLVVRAQDRRPVGPDHAVVADDGDDAPVGAGGVHVRRDQDRALASAGPHGDDVADLVARDGAAELAEPSLEILADLLLVTGGTVDRHQVQERPQQALAIDVLPGRCAAM